MSEIIDLLVKKESVSDETYKVACIWYENGAKINRGDIVLSFETSKATIDIESQSDGYIFYNCKLGNELPVGFLFASISTAANLPENHFREKEIIVDTKRAVKQNIAKIQEVRVSKPAAKLIAENKIDISVFGGKKIIEKKDIEDYLLTNKSKLLNTNEVNRLNRIVIVGGGNHTKVCIDILKQTNAFEIYGVVYTKYAPDRDEILGIPVIGGLDKLEQIYKDEAAMAVVGIGGLDKPIERAQIIERLKTIGFFCPNIIHPKAIIEPSASLGEGNQIMAGAVIGSCAKMGNNCIVNSNSIVSHDCIIGNNVHITPGAIIAGTVSIGDNSIIGMGVTVYYHSNIGNNVIIINGKHIFKDIPNNSFVK